MIQRHPIEPCVMDLLQLHRDLLELQPTRLRHLLAAIDEFTPDGYPTQVAGHQGHLGVEERAPIRLDGDGNLIEADPLHGTATEKAALMRAEIRGRLERVMLNARRELARAYAEVLHLEQHYRPVKIDKAPRCCGGWGDSQDSTCRENAVKTVVPADGPWRGSQFDVCVRCWERCRKADQRAEQRQGAA